MPANNNINKSFLPGEKLFEEKEYYRFLLDNLDEIILIITKTGKVAYANKKTFEVSGYKKEEFIGNSILKYLTASSKKIAVEALAKEFMGITHTGLELEVKLKSGETRLLFITGNAVKIYESGKMAGVLINAHDITEEKIARERLRESEEKYRSIFESANDIIVIIDKKGKIIDVNDKLLELGGYKREEIVDKSVKALTKVITKKGMVIIMKNLLARMTGAEVMPYEVEFLKKDRSVMFAEINATAIKRGDEIIGDVAIIRDITERRKNEEKISESERKYKLIAENTSDFIVLMSFELNPRFLYVSPSHEAAFGYKPEELVGKRGIEFIHPDDRKELISLLTAYLGEKAKKLVGMSTKAWHENLKYRFKNKFGKWRYVECTADLVGDKILMVSRDITERKLQEEKVIKFAEEWSKTFDSINDGISIHSPDFEILQVNNAICRLFGTTKEELIGEKCYSVFHDKNSSISDCPLAKTIKSKKKETVEYYEPKLKRWIFGATSPMFDEKGKIIKIVHIIRDITERKQAEEELLEEKRKAEEYLDVAGAIIIAINKDYKVSLINKTGSKTLGYKRDEIIGKNWFDNFMPEENIEETRAVFGKIMAGGLEEFEYFENPVLTKSGEKILVYWHNAPLKDKEGKIIGTLSSGEDITDRKRIEGEIKKRANELERSNRLMIGRELKMVELKKRIKELEAHLKTDD